MYIEGDTPIMIGRAYGRVSRTQLRKELLRRWATWPLCSYGAGNSIIINLEKNFFVSKNSWKYHTEQEFDCDREYLIIQTAAGVQLQVSCILTLKLKGFWRLMRIWATLSAEMEETSSAGMQMICSEVILSFTYFPLWRYLTSCQRCKTVAPKVYFMMLWKRDVRRGCKVRGVKCKAVYMVYDWALKTKVDGDGFMWEVGGVLEHNMQSV